MAVPTPSLEELGAKNEGIKQEKRVSLSIMIIIADSGRAIIEDDALFADWWVVEHASQVSPLQTTREWIFYCRPL